DAQSASGGLTRRTGRPTHDASSWAGLPPVRPPVAVTGYGCVQSSPMMTNEGGSCSCFSSAVRFGSAGSLAAGALLRAGAGAAAAAFVSEPAPLLGGGSSVSSAAGWRRAADPCPAAGFVSVRPDFADDVSALAFDDSDFEASVVEASVASEDSDAEASDPEAADEGSSDCADRERRRPLRERERPLPRSAVSDFSSPRDWSSVLPSAEPVLVCFIVAVAIAATAERDASEDTESSCESVSLCLDFDPESLRRFRSRRWSPPEDRLPRCDFEPSSSDPGSSS